MPQNVDQYLGLDKYHAPQWLGARASRRFHVMVQPAGSACNLNCSHCFYLSKRTLPVAPATRWRVEPTFVWQTYFPFRWLPRAS